MTTFTELAERNQIIHPEVSAALGVAVTHVWPGTGQRTPLGVVLEVTADRYGVWVRRFGDSADVSVWYAAKELEIATPDDLASIARTMLGWQYREALDLRAKHAR